MALRVQNDDDRNSRSRNADGTTRQGPRLVEPGKGIGQIGDWWTNVGRQGANLAGDIGNWLGGRNPIKHGQGAGDYAFGVPSTSVRRSGRPGGNTFGPPVAPEEGPSQNTSLPDLESFLSRAMELMGGGGQLGRVSYDPLRDDARTRSTEYDARLNAMYDQLQGSIRDDGASIQENYGGAIDQNAARSEQTQQQIQGAGNAAADRNVQALQSLGIGEAAGNIVAEGRDLNTQVAGSVQDAAARGQISGDALQQNQQSSGAHNTNLVGAAGLEGNLQRARVQSELGSLLAQYDMEEQSANQQIDAQNAQMQQSRQSSGLGLAQALYGSAWDQQKYTDELAQMQYEMQAQANQPNKATQSMQFLQQLLSQYPDMDMDQISQLMGALGSSSKLF